MEGRSSVAEHSQEPTGPHYSTLPSDDEARIPPGTVVASGRFEIVEELARGGMAIVYRAKDRDHDGVEVALKVVTASADGTDTTARYENEARLGASLAAHPHVVRPLAVGRLDAPAGFAGRMYLVTELVRGRSLSELMLQHRTGLPIERAPARSRPTWREHWSRSTSAASSIGTSSRGT